MNTTVLPEINKTRFLAMNFNRLQGLRAALIGLFACLITILVNFRLNRTWILLGFAVIALLCIGLYWLVERYYVKRFGHVVASSKIRQTEWIFMIVGGIMGLAAFWLDTSFRLPVSFVGLAISIGFLLNYFRIAYKANYWFSPVVPLLSSLVLLIVSILPALNLDRWWVWVGIRFELLGILFVAGAVLVISGLISHFQFIHLLAEESRHGKSI